MGILNPKFSVIIPCYRSAASVQILCERLRSHFENLGETFEVILVDDGSSDGTLTIVKKIASDDSRFKVLALFKNFGQINALMAGFNHATGSRVAIMDDDLETSVSDLTNLDVKLSQGYDYVYACPKKRPTSLWRNWGSRLNDWMATFLIKKPKDLVLSSFMMTTREIVEQVIRYEGPFPYLAGVLLRISDKGGNLEVEYQKRHAGKSNYNLRRLVRLWLNGFTNFSVVPLRLSFLLGFFLAFVGVALSVVLSVKRFWYPDIPPGWTSLQVSLLFLFGVQFMILGLLGEYVGRIFMVLNRHPQFAIREKINL